MFLGSVPRLGARSCEAQDPPCIPAPPGLPNFRSLLWLQTPEWRDQPVPHGVRSGGRGAASGLVMMLEAALGLPRAPHWVAPAGGGYPKAGAREPHLSRIWRRCRAWGSGRSAPLQTHLLRCKGIVGSTHSLGPRVGGRPPGQALDPRDQGSGPHLAVLPKAPAHVPKGPESAGWVGGSSQSPEQGWCGEG